MLYQVERVRELMLRRSDMGDALVKVYHSISPSFLPYLIIYRSELAQQLSYQL
jgi:hypothetical protein